MKTLVFLSSLLIGATGDSPIEQYLDFRGLDPNTNLLVLAADLSGDDKEEFFISQPELTNARAGNMWFVYLWKEGEYERLEEIISFRKDAFYVGEIDGVSGKVLVSLLPSGGEATITGKQIQDRRLVELEPLGRTTDGTAITRQVLDLIRNDVETPKVRTGSAKKIMSLLSESDPEEPETAAPESDPSQPPRTAEPDTTSPPHNGPSTEAHSPPPPESDATPDAADDSEPTNPTSTGIPLVVGIAIAALLLLGGAYVAVRRSR